MKGNNFGDNFKRTQNLSQAEYDNNIGDEPFTWLSLQVTSNLSLMSHLCSGICSGIRSETLLSNFLSVVYQNYQEIPEQHAEH